MKYSLTTLFLIVTVSAAAAAEDSLQLRWEEYGGGRDLEEDSTCYYFLDESSQVSYQPAAATNQTARPICDSFSGSVTFHKGGEYCCTFLTRLNILDGNSGGFSIEYDTPITRGSPAESEEIATCYAYMDALSDTVCSPEQGTYMSDGTFSVCEDSCDLVYEKCTDIINFGAGVTDGKSFCEDAWNSKCDDYATGFICGSNLELNVASEECLAIVEPTDDTIATYVEHSASEETWGCTVRFLWVYGTITAVILLCCCACICMVCCRKK